MQNLTLEQLRLVLLCSGVIALVCVFVYGVLPELRVSRDHATQLQQAQSRLASGKVSEADVQAISREVEQLRAALDGDGRVPPRQAEAALLRMLHQYAEEVGLRLVGVAPNRQQRPDGVLILQFEVEAVGSYSSSAQWLEALDAPNSNIVLSEFSLAPESRDGSSLRLRASLRAFRYQAKSA